MVIKDIIELAEGNRLKQIIYQHVNKRLYAKLATLFVTVPLLKVKVDFIICHASEGE